MTAFRYRAVDADGKTRKGVLEVDNARQARARLREMGLLPVEVSAIAGDGESKWKNRRGFGPAGLAVLTRQFATLLEAGLTVEAVLTALSEQAENDYTKEILAGVRAEVLSGATLSTALGRYGRVFPEVYQALVNAGEESGELPQVMLRLADYVENRNELRQKVVLSFVYPLAVTTVAAAVIAGLLVYVVPQVVEVFAHSRQTLPVLTRALIFLSDALRSTGWYLFAAMAAISFFAKSALKKPEVKLRWHEFLLRLPHLGNLVRGINSARFSGTLAILVGSGVPLLQALQAGARVTASLPMKRAVEETLAAVREGSSLARALKESGRFPPLLVHLVANGEASGRLSSMLERAAAEQEREVEQRTAILTALMEPVLIVVMGGIVLLIVLAILLPIIEMNQLVR